MEKIERGKDGTGKAPAYALGEISLRLDGSGDALVDAITREGWVLGANPTQRELLGLDELPQRIELEAIYTADSCRSLLELFARDLPTGFVTSLELELRGREGEPIPVLARCCKIAAHPEHIFRLTKLPFGAANITRRELFDLNSLLRQILDQARDGHWCIEFLEPVSLDRPEAAIIAQIFENAAVWRVANRAMARLYELPDDAMIQEGDVHLYWPRSPENERFVTEIIRSNYAIDRALSVDMRHDGTPIVIENDVRAHFHDGQLIRIWGRCRELPDDAGMSARLQETSTATVDEPGAGRGAEAGTGGAVGA
ncbi:MAG: hypothetical protein JHD35_03045 [Sphingopyxis sp.]|nr:hypothetical protein [Sphingopyxis sp.]